MTSGLGFDFESLASRRGESPWQLVQLGWPFTAAPAWQTALIRPGMAAIPRLVTGERSHGIAASWDVMVMAPVISRMACLPSPWMHRSMTSPLERHCCLLIAVDKFCHRIAVAQFQFVGGASLRSSFYGRLQLDGRCMAPITPLSSARPRMGMYDYIDPRTLLLSSEDLKKSQDFWLQLS